MGVINLVVTFVAAIAFAVLLNEVRNTIGKKTVQTISYLPHFLSWIIVTGIIHDALSGTGIINELLVNLNVINQPINFLLIKSISGLLSLLPTYGKKPDGMQLYIWRQ